MVLLASIFDVLLGALARRQPRRKTPNLQQEAAHGRPLRQGHGCIVKAGCPVGDGSRRAGSVMAERGRVAFDSDVAPRRDYETAPGSFGIEVLSPAEALRRIRG